MTLQSTLQALARAFVGLALVAAALPLMTSDAEARRKVTADAAPAVRTINRSTEEKSTEEPAATDEDATASSSGDAAAPVARAQSVVKAKAAKVSKPADIEVPGCSPGMICTVCLAGCNGAVNVIVHAVPKQK
jgi:hypothetical protein